MHGWCPSEMLDMRTKQGTTCLAQCGSGVYAATYKQQTLKITQTAGVLKFSGICEKKGATTTTTPVPRPPAVPARPGVIPAVPPVPGAPYQCHDPGFPYASTNADFIRVGARMTISVPDFMKAKICFKLATEKGHCPSSTPLTHWYYLLTFFGFMISKKLEVSRSCRRR